MLTSMIKPCNCRMSHFTVTIWERLITKQMMNPDVEVTWITALNALLIHAKSSASSCD